MRCYICDRVLNEPKFNPDIAAIDPCDTCMAIIEDTLAGFTDKPAAAEGEISLDPIWDEVFPQMYEPFGDT
jgi:hypothetical protein